MGKPLHPDTFRFDDAQHKSIIDKVVPLIAKPEDQEFFRGILWCRADASKSSSDFAYFISTLLKEGEKG